MLLKVISAGRRSMFNMYCGFLCARPPSSASKSKNRFCIVQWLTLSLMANVYIANLRWVDPRSTRAARYRTRKHGWWSGASKGLFGGCLATNKLFPSGTPCDNVEKRQEIAANNFFVFAPALWGSAHPLCTDRRTLTMTGPKCTPVEPCQQCHGLQFLCRSSVVEPDVDFFLVTTNQKAKPLEWLQDSGKT